MFAFLKRKKIKVPVSNETKYVDAVQLWIVTWHSRCGEFYMNVVKEHEAFTSKEAAYDFAESLKKAHILLRNTSGTSVKVYTKESDKP